MSEARPGSAVVSGLIGPLLRQRRFSATDPLAALLAACDLAQGLPAPHLAKVLDLLLNSGLKVIKAARLKTAIEDVRKGGLMLVVTRGSPEFAAWRAHYEKTSPAFAKNYVARTDKLQVPSRFPPAEPRTEEARQ